MNHQWLSRIDFEHGWKILQSGITKLHNILDGETDIVPFTTDDDMMLYTLVYNMCTQRELHTHCWQLYVKYRESFEEYITLTVLPSLRQKHDEFMLKELVKRWSNHKKLMRKMSWIFNCVDRLFVHSQKELPSLNVVGMLCFRDLVYRELNTKARDVVISMINQQREGYQIDQVLLKNVVDIFVEVGMGKLDCYANDFEAAMLMDTTAYYSRKASSWIFDDSGSNYMLKVEECLKREMYLASHYLHPSSETKLLEALKEAFDGRSIAEQLTRLAIK